MNILVVGGAGYIGGATVDTLKRKGHDVTVYDILAYEERFLKPVNFIYGDIRDRKKLLEVLPEFEVVVWLAAIVGDGACAVDPYLTQAVNEDAVKWLVDNYKGRIIFPSTCSVYGVNEDLIDETAKPNPRSIYAETKLAAEQYILKKAENRSLIFRLGTLFGIGDTYSRLRLDLVINVLAMKAARKQKLTVYGGNQWRPLIHVADVATAMETGIFNGSTGLYNLASFNCTIKSIAEEIQLAVPGCKVEKVDMQFEDQRNYRVSTRKWKSIISSEFEQNLISLEGGIKEIVDLIKDDRIKNPMDPIYSNQLQIEQQYRRWI